MRVSLISARLLSTLELLATWWKWWCMYGRLLHRLFYLASRNGLSSSGKQLTECWQRNVEKIMSLALVRVTHWKGIMSSCSDSAMAIQPSVVCILKQANTGFLNVLTIQYCNCNSYISECLSVPFMRYHSAFVNEWPINVENKQCSCVKKIFHFISLLGDTYYTQVNIYWKVSRWNWLKFKIKLWRCARRLSFCTC